MWVNLLQKTKALFCRKSSEFSFEPVTHHLPAHPILPQSMMEAIAPAYEEMLSKEKEEQGENAPLQSEE